MTRLIYGFRTRSKTPASWTVRESAHGTQDRTVKAESDGLRAVFEHLTCAHVTRVGPYRPTITNGIASSRQAHPTDPDAPTDLREEFNIKVLEARVQVRVHREYAWGTPGPSVQF